MRRRLVLSLLTLVRCIKNGSINPQDLDRDLFFMWCTRRVARNFDHPSNPVRTAYGDTEEGKCIHALLMDAWDKAEQEGRVCWRDRREDARSYEELNAFLEANKYGENPLNLSDQKPLTFHTTRAAKRVQAAHLDLEVVGLSYAPA